MYMKAISFFFARTFSLYSLSQCGLYRRFMGDCFDESSNNRTELIDIIPSIGPNLAPLSVLILASNMFEV
jgi:hypothetical protein